MASHVILFCVFVNPLPSYYVFLLARDRSPHSMSIVSMVMTPFGLPWLDLSFLCNLKSNWAIPSHSIPFHPIPFHFIWNGRRVEMVKIKIAMCTNIKITFLSLSEEVKLNFDKNHLSKKTLRHSWNHWRCWEYLRSSSSLEVALTVGTTNANEKNTS